MTEEILERSLRIYNRIKAIESALGGIVGVDGQINRLNRIEVRVYGSEYSVILDDYNSDQVISILSKEMKNLKDEFENIKA